MPTEPNTKEPNAEGSNDTRPKSHKDAHPADALAADVNRFRAVELRLAGKSFRAIARILDISKETAFRWVQDGWDRVNDMTDEARAQLRDQQEARLDKALEVIMPLLEAENLVAVTEDGKGNEVRLDAAELKLKAVDRLVKVVQAQCVLRGLNAPTKLEVTKGKRTLISLEELRVRAKASMKNRLNAAKGATN